MGLRARGYLQAALALATLCVASSVSTIPGYKTASQPQQPEASAATMGKKFPVKWSDLVAAMPVDDKHVALAKASRYWRKGIRTVIASNLDPSPEQKEEGRQFNETWTWYPDDAPLRSLYGGDTRAALVPFIAHRELGDTYKWLLYGDDDTVWFMDGMIRVLEDLDPDMPYFLTDHMWWSSHPGRASHPNHEAPRCLPCNFDDTGIEKTRQPYNAPKGCPCTPQLLCDTDDRGVFNKQCDIPRAPIATFSMHGGAGGIISIGLLRAVGFDFMEKCIKSLYSTGGDAFISICLWQAGYATTDPGYSFIHPEVQMFDPGPEDRMGVMMKLVRALDNRCDEICQHQLDKMITLHVRSRVFPLLEDAAQFIKAVAAMYDVYIDTKRAHALQALANVGETASAASEAAAEATRQAQATALKEAAAQAAAQNEAAQRNAASSAAKAEAEDAAIQAAVDAAQAQRKADVTAEAAKAANNALTVAATTGATTTTGTAAQQVTAAKTSRKVLEHGQQAL